MSHDNELTLRSGEIVTVSPGTKVALIVEAEWCRSPGLLVVNGRSRNPSRSWCHCHGERGAVSSSGIRLHGNDRPDKATERQCAACGLVREPDRIVTGHRLLAPMRRTCQDRMRALNLRGRSGE